MSNSGHGFNQQLGSPGTQPEPRRWCGLRPRVALAVTALAALIIIAAVVGGTVGGLASHRENSRESGSSSSSSSPGLVSTTAPTSTSTGSTPSTSTPSTSTSLASPTPSNGILPLNCPAINNTQYTTEDQSFYIYCQMDFKSPSGNIAQSLQMSVGDCIDSCAEHNTNTSQTVCQGMTFGANLTR